MKILIVCSTIDLKYKMGCTPAWWLLIKAIYEIGHDPIVVPYLGKPVDSLWWRTYPNPLARESALFNQLLNLKKRLNGNGTSKASMNGFAGKYVRNKWERSIREILVNEKDVGAVLFMNVPLTHIKGIPQAIHDEFGIPVAFYDGDMPTALPKYAVDRGFKFSYFEGIDLSEYDAFFTNSVGVIPDLRELNARNVYPLHYAIDPDLIKPMDIPKDMDISFYGVGDQFREEWMTKMITMPSQRLQSVDFVVAGRGFKIDLGRSRMVGDMPYSSFGSFCCSSKICLNITRWSHTCTYGSSTARPFELAGYGSCIVSQPYNGIEEWFDVGKEIVVVNSEEEAICEYQRLLDDLGEALEMGRRARARVLRDHTFVNRAQFLLDKLRT